MNKGKLRVGIDFRNKGWVNFGQWTYAVGSGTNDYHSPHLFFSQPGYQISGTPPDEIFECEFSPLNPYGFEVAHIKQTVSNVIQFGIDTSSHVSTPVGASTEYTFWIWIASSEDYTNDGSHVFSVSTIEHSSDLGTVEATSATNIDLVGDNTIYAHKVHFTTTSDSAWLTFAITKNDLDSTESDIRIYGVMLMGGDVTDEPTWNPATYGSDDNINDNDEITDYILSVQGSIGKTQWENKLFDEGTLTITVNNQSKYFSPENSDSPYSDGLSAPYARVFVLLSDSEDVYHLLWSGFTQQIALHTGIYRDRQATITCRQGLYAIQAQDPTLIQAAEYVTSSQAIRNMFGGGYQSATGVGINDTELTAYGILEKYEDGVTIPIFGTDFVGESLQNQNGQGYSTALSNISELNGNYLFLSRNNRIIFRAYATVRDETPEKLDYGLTESMEYIYSPTDLYQEIVVNYDVYDRADSGYEMQGQEVTIAYGSSDFPFQIYPEYNGKPFIGNVVLDVSSFLPVDYTQTITGGTANAAFTENTNGIYTWYSALANNSLTSTLGGLDARLSLASHDSSGTWYCITPNKQLVVIGDDPIGLVALTYSNPLITTDDMATNFADMQVERRGLIKAWFQSAKIINKNDTAIDFIIQHTLGNTVYSQEEQSGNLLKHLCIIGESWNWKPNYFEMNYVLAPTGGTVLITGFTESVSGQNVDFINETVSDPDTTYLWDFGD